ncbi:DoxX family protein [Variovorax sp. NFACC27]|nr:DoxX family protein [Variovorax gossypii]MDP9606283.1 small-conductance mechanosensitive channel [Variovorax paradoxus]SEF35372.1 DoxX-like family protein [Variovorax sp. NFACC28]SEG99342.1 DoxX-like family protein [Variovorax sp. NFACC29]SFE22316.1 DoxX-like family protein [Variovorax sp. NFACC26]SFH27212.1 DoxX-like family protein [Variovorax sp. NFACC27]
MTLDQENLMTGNYTYWISTALLSLLYLASAAAYVAKRDWVRQALADLGYPGYLVPVLTVVKILAVAAILSRISVPLSDLAYAGMFYHLLLSGLAHIGVRKPGGALPAAVGLVLLVASFATQNLARDIPSPDALAMAAQQATLN